jgi:hypothetical protein
VTFVQTIHKEPKIFQNISVLIRLSYIQNVFIALYMLSLFIPAKNKLFYHVSIFRSLTTSLVTMIKSKALCYHAFGMIVSILPLCLIVLPCSHIVLHILTCTYHVIICIMQLLMGSCTVTAHWSLSRVTELDSTRLSRMASILSSLSLPPHPLVFLCFISTCHLAYLIHLCYPT